MKYSPEEYAHAIIDAAVSECGISASTVVRNMISQAKAEEREACAKIADGFASTMRAAQADARDIDKDGSAAALLGGSATAVEHVAKAVRACGRTRRQSGPCPRQKQRRDHSHSEGEGMSYNIDSVECPVMNARIAASDLRTLLRKHRRDLPGNNFLDQIKDAEPDADGDLQIKHLSWSSEGSGHAWDLLVQTVAPKIKGEVEAIFTWEGGDSLSGLKIKDGEVTECDVVQTLVPRKK